MATSGRSTRELHRVAGPPPARIRSPSSVSSVAAVSVNVGARLRRAERLQHLAALDDRTRLGHGHDPDPGRARLCTRARQALTGEVDQAAAHRAPGDPEQLRDSAPPAAARAPCLRTRCACRNAATASPRRLLLGHRPLYLSTTRIGPTRIVRRFRSVDQCSDSVGTAVTLPTSAGRTGARLPEGKTGSGQSCESVIRRRARRWPGALAPWPR